MIEAKLWRAGKRRTAERREWRERRSRFGELVQWDTSEHDWLEGRGDEMLLINMIDDATSRWFGRFVTSDSTVENMNLVEGYVKTHGRPLAYYTDKAALFQTAKRPDETIPGRRRIGRNCHPHRLAARCRSGNHVNQGPLPASERTHRTRICHGSGPAGEGHARSGHHDHRASQPLS